MLREVGLISLTLALALASYSAQEQLRQSQPVTVRGVVVNGTDGSEVPAGLGLMLHGWGSDGAPLEMIHGETQAGGRFTFSDVILDPNGDYAVMAVFQEVAYFSGAVQRDADGQAAPIEVQVFETTDCRWRPRS